MALPLAALAAAWAISKAVEVGAKKYSADKQDKAMEKRNKAIEREERKNAIARALGTDIVSRRKMPSGKADTWISDTIGGLGSVGSSMATMGVGDAIFKGITQQDKMIGPQVKAEPRPLLDNSPLLKDRRFDRRGSFDRYGSNIG